MSGKSKTSAPNSSAKDCKETNSTKQTCPLADKVKLVELVEVVMVNGSETTQAPAGRKQYINILPAVEPAVAHAEYGRFITLKARVEWAGGDKSRSLSGQTVYWYYKADGGNRVGLTGAVKEGFGGDVQRTTASTDEKGWTGQVKFFLSQFGGDQFDIYATDDPEYKGGIKAGTYIVWRKFWYQVTRANTHVVPAPAKSVTAYDKVYAEMLAADEATFAEGDAPAQTFYPGWMVKIGGGDSKESVIGGHNRDSFYTKFKEETTKPVKGHLIICQHQWDPFGESALLTSVINKTPSDELTLNLDGAWNAGIVKPALKGDLIVVGTWSGDGKNGNLTEANILIEKTRSALNAVKVSLPDDAPDPTKTPVTVNLKLRYGKYYAGESNKHHMLIKYDGAEANFTQVVSHEFGHGFGQAPRPAAQTAPLVDHPKQYDNAHGGVGSHCSTDASLVDDPQYPLKRYKDGTCIMFHQINPAGCKQVFCATCEPYIRLHDFSALT